MAQFLLMFGILSVITPVMMIMNQGDGGLRLDAQQRRIMRNMFVGGVTIFVISISLMLWI